MPTLRVSATDIDALRRYLNPPDYGDEPELADLLAQLRREAPPTETMLAGTAMHKALENCAAGEFSELSADGYTFVLDIEGEIDLPEIREMKATRIYQVGDVTVTLVGKVDAIHGQRVDDHKFTSRYDAERFLSSYQWRIYLEIFGANTFRWNVFEGRETEPKRYVVTALHQLRMHRYPDMEADVAREVAAFANFARVHLPERLLPLAA